MVTPTSSDEAIAPQALAVREAATDSGERENELADFLERVQIPLHRLAQDGTILWANAATCALLGWSLTEFVGHNIREFYVEQDLAARAIGQLSGNQDPEPHEARFRCRDGTVRYVSVQTTVYRQNDRFISARCLTVNLIEARRSTELHERLAAIVESSDDAIISKDVNGIIQSWNRGAQAIFGYSADEVIGKHISMLAAPDHVDEIPAILDRLRRGERVDHYETKRKTKDGRILTVSLTVSPIRDAAGNIIGASKVARDHTDLARQTGALQHLNEALTRSNEDLQQFVYSASHDLQEPLRMIAIYSQLLRKDYQDKLGPAGNQYLDHAIDGAVRMERLLAALRAYTRASIASQDVTEPIDTGAAMDRVLANVEPALAEGGVEITRATLPVVRIHAFQIEQVFQNLIGNALRYKKPGTLRINIGCEDQGDHWLFSVQDNGIGIGPEYKEQIFGIFQRLHTTAEYPGTGMGLAICERIITRAGGRIWVESQPGEGSTFFFTLPNK
ncbi:MAG: sensor signal transduction histidine kinase [Bryobacterales bacterium]|nr:sensor signal transduction histidine kinase [Bryobacterales bacterium]